MIGVEEFGSRSGTGNSSDNKTDEGKGIWVQHREQPTNFMSQFKASYRVGLSLTHLFIDSYRHWERMEANM